MLHLNDRSAQDTTNLARALGGHAWALLLAGRPAEAVVEAREAIRRDSTQMFVRTNLAHGLVLTGHFDEGMAIYRTYWTKPLFNQTFGQAVLQDFHDLAAAGIKDPRLRQAEDALRKEFPGARPGA
jgi:hypothetical protein